MSTFTTLTQEQAIALVEKLKGEIHNDGKLKDFLEHSWAIKNNTLINDAYYVSGEIAPTRDYLKQGDQQKP